MDTVKVLLVDDEAVICEGLKSDFMKMRHPWEYQVFTAQSVPEAEEIYYREGADLIVTDIHMPKGSGLLLIMEMRKDNPDLGILVLSAYDNFEYVRNAFTMGADDYLLKPVAFSELEQKAKQLLLRTMRQETAAEGERAPSSIEEILEYIRAHIGEKITAAEMAKKMAVGYGNFGKPHGDGFFGVCAELPHGGGERISGKSAHQDQADRSEGRLPRRSAAFFPRFYPADGAFPEGIPRADPRKERGIKNMWKKMLSSVTIVNGWRFTIMRGNPKTGMRRKHYGKDSCVYETQEHCDLCKEIRD